MIKFLSLYIDLKYETQNEIKLPVTYRWLDMILLFTNKTLFIIKRQIV